MIKFYQKLNIYLKVVFWDLIISIGVAILLIPLFFFSLMEIPLGILLGMAIGCLYYFFAGMNQRESYEKTAMTIDVILLVVRFVLFMGVFVGISLMYYKGNMHIFNVYSYIGSYLFSLLIFLFLSRKEGKK